MDTPTFTQPFRRAVDADAAELAVNPSSRSAFLRVGIRTDAPARPLDRDAIALPRLPQKGGRR